MGWVWRDPLIFRGCLKKVFLPKSCVGFSFQVLKTRMIDEHPTSNIILHITFQLKLFTFFYNV